MEEDDADDMIMVIVADGSDEIQPLPMVKQEPLNEDSPKGSEEVGMDVESILQTAELHGQYISLDDVNEDADCEYLETYFTESNELNAFIKHEVKNEDLSDDESNRKQKKPQHSYVAELRKTCSKMQKDENLLVSSLSEIMRLTKPPAPPTNFCRLVLQFFGCVYCDMENETLPSAIRHYQERHGPRYLICFACGMDFRSTTTLYKHEKRCTAPDARVVLKARGRYLGRKGRSRPFRTMDRFETSTSDTKPRKIGNRYFCSQCSSSYINREGLTAHEYTHLGIRPHQCDQCPLAYTSYSALKRHLNQHRNMTYICDVCGRSFKLKPTLVSHMNTHLSKPKYGCDRCDRRFSQKSAVEDHINRDHLKAPPKFACAACPKRFWRTSNLKEHMKKNHGLTLMTRKMFFKALPMMKGNELKQATIVFKGDEGSGMTAPLHTMMNEDLQSVSKEPELASNADTRPVNAEKRPVRQTQPQAGPQTQHVTDKKAVTKDLRKYRKVVPENCEKDSNFKYQLVTDNVDRKSIVENSIIKSELAQIMYQKAVANNSEMGCNLSENNENGWMITENRQVCKKNLSVKQPEPKKAQLNSKMQKEIVIERKNPSRMPTFVLTQSGVTKTPNGIIIRKHSKEGNTGFRKFR